MQCSTIQHMRSCGIDLPVDWRDLGVRAADGEGTGTKTAVPLPRRFSAASLEPPFQGPATPAAAGSASITAACSRPWRWPWPWSPVTIRGSPRGRAPSRCLPFAMLRCHWRACALAPVLATSWPGCCSTRSRRSPAARGSRRASPTAAWARVPGRPTTHGTELVARSSVTPLSRGRSRERRGACTRTTRQPRSPCPHSPIDTARARRARASPPNGDGPSTVGSCNQSPLTRSSPWPPQLEGTDQPGVSWKSPGPAAHNLGLASNAHPGILAR
jgi:hypothetical protein